MKPDWKDAPDWARFLGMDWFGIWWWFENKPISHGYTGTNAPRFEHIGRAQQAYFQPGYVEEKGIQP
jgi:hypothetical protein